MSSGKYKTVNARLSITLRADDIAVLEYIRRETGCGLLSYAVTRGVGQDKVVWEALSASACVHLRNNLAGRLRAKKSKDFILWSEAVGILDRQGGGQNSPEYRRLLELKTILSEVKLFTESDAAYARTEYGVRRADSGHYLKRSKWNHTKALDVAEIRAKYETGNYTQAMLAEEYGIHRMTANKIVKGTYRSKSVPALPDISRGRATLR